MRTFAIIGVLAIGLITQARADIFATGYFTGDIYRFNEQTAQQSVFASVGTFSGLAGIAYNPLNNRIYVSVQNLSSVYAYDANTGTNVGQFSLGYSPAGLSVASNGNVYVARFGSAPPNGQQPPLTTAEVRIYAPDFVAAPTVITVPNVPVGAAGIGFAANGDGYITTNGAGIYRLPSGSSTPVPFTDQMNPPLAIGQVAVGLNGKVYAGDGSGFSSSVLRFDSNGALDGPPITISESMVNTTGPQGGSALGTSPAGVVVDAAGDVIVAVLGRSNPFDPQGQNGGLFKFGPNGGSPTMTFLTDGPALSSVTIGPTAVPEPSSIGLMLLASAGVMAYKRRLRGTAPAIDEASST